jgi:hypothetical protein
VARKPRYTPEQIIGKLRDAEVKLAKGTRTRTQSYRDRIDSDSLGQAGAAWSAPHRSGVGSGRRGYATSRPRRGPEMTSSGGGLLERVVISKEWGDTDSPNYSGGDRAFPDQTLRQ